MKFKAMTVKIIICAFCIAGAGGVFAAGQKGLHGHGQGAVTACSGATNDLVYSNNCSGVYYRTIQQP